MFENYTKSMKTIKKLEQFKNIFSPSQGLRNISEIYFTDQLGGININLKIRWSV